MLLKFINKIATRRKKVKFPIQQYGFLKDTSLEAQIMTNGFVVVNLLDETEINLLQALYNSNHALKTNSGGAFFGIFSKDIDYRKLVHQKIDNILRNKFQQYFTNYKTVVNTFVIKCPGNSSFIPIHQDGAALDEEVYSSINVWIPLQTMNETNGCLCLIPGSHKIFIPYRCASVPPLQMNIEEHIMPFFEKIFLEVGQAIFFDSRAFHYSPPNSSDKNRVVVVSRVCPAKANIIAYYRPDTHTNKIEMWQCPDDYLVYSNNYDDNKRPINCKFAGYRKTDVTPLTFEEFRDRMNNRLTETNQVSDIAKKQWQRNFITEPK